MEAENVVQVGEGGVGVFVLPCPVVGVALGVPPLKVWGGEVGGDVVGDGAGGGVGGVDESDFHEFIQLVKYSSTCELLYFLFFGWEVVWASTNGRTMVRSKKNRPVL